MPASEHAGGARVDHLPGTTSEVLVPKLTEKGLVVGKDRGSTPQCVDVAQALYSQIRDKLVPLAQWPRGVLPGSAEDVLSESQLSQQTSYASRAVV